MKRFAKRGMPDEKKLRVVIDTNLLISSAIVAKSPPDKLIRLWLKKAFILLTTHEQLEEIKEVSQRKKLKYRPLFPKRIAELLGAVEFVSELIEPIPEKDLSIYSRDPEDDFLLAAALGGKADYLITGDRDLLVLTGNPYLGRLKIITVKEFLRLI